MASRISATNPEFVSNAALGAVIFTLLVVFLINVAGSPVSFDGAMNLQVAATLVERGEYARFYDTWTLFPKEIQTNAPYLLPAALSFAVFGVTLFSAQLASIAYVIGLIFVVYWLVRPLAGNVPAFGAIALVLVAPEFSRFGANGYGEIPGLFWFLLGLGLFAKSLQNRAGNYQILGGLALGLSVLTKTVMLMPVGITLALFCLVIVHERNWRSLIIVPAAFVLPIAGFEIWRLFAIGGLAEWMAWWDNQLSSILSQAGVQERFEDTPNRLEKLVSHASVLASKLSIPIGLLPILSLIPIGLFILVLHELRKDDCAWPRVLVLVSLFATICAYFVWWLLVTPTEKAWHRRIFNGLTLLAVAAPLVLHGFIRAWKNSRGLVALLSLPVILLIYSGLAEFRAPDEQQRRLESVLKGIEFAQSGPVNARFYGVGWYSAPVFSLYSGARVYDLMIQKHFQSFDTGHHFLVADAGMIQSGMYERALQNLDSKIVLDASPWLRIVEISGPHRLEAIPDWEDHELKSRIDFRASEYTLLSGFNSPEGEGWRWVEPASRIVLEYSEGAQLVVEGYTVAADRYRIFGGDSAFKIEAIVDGCSLGRKTIQGMGHFEFSWSLHSCTDLPEGPLIVEFRTNGVLGDVSRPLSWIANAIGFQPVDRPGPPR